MPNATAILRPTRNTRASVQATSAGLRVVVTRHATRRYAPGCTSIGTTTLLDTIVSDRSAADRAIAQAVAS